MLRRFTIMLLIGACCSQVMAQSARGSDDPKFELFAGYSANGYFVEGSSITAAPGQKISSFFTDRAGGSKGFEVSLDRNFNRYIGLKGDFSSYFEILHGRGTVCQGGACTTGNPFKVPLRSFYFTAGPEFKLRNSTRLTPFAHALFGGVASRAEFEISAPGIRVSDSTTRTGFAASFGGGVDIRLCQRVSLRTMADYTATFLAEPNPGESRPQNHVRTSVGILFQFH
jgi:opacity protein-like surface antigen